MYDYNYKSNEKQVKETVPTCSQNWLLPATLGDQKRRGHFRLGDWRQFQNQNSYYNNGFNNYNAGNMFGYFGQQQQGYNSRYYGPCMAMEAAHYLSNNQIPPFPLPPAQYYNPQNDPYGPTVVRDFPGGVHTITVPGPGGGTAICM